MLRALIATYPRVWRAGPARAFRLAPEKLPAYLVLLRVGFTLPPTLQPERCALTAPFHPYRILAGAAVFSLWHLPSRSLDAPVPDVIRHTALRSSDFPLPVCLAANRQRSPSHLPSLIVSEPGAPFFASLLFAKSGSLAVRRRYDDSLPGSCLFVTSHTWQNAPSVGHPAIRAIAFQNSSSKRNR